MCAVFFFLLLNRRQGRSVATMMLSSSLSSSLSLCLSPSLSLCLSPLSLSQRKMVVLSGANGHFKFSGAASFYGLLFLWRCEAKGGRRRRGKSLSCRPPKIDTPMRAECAEKRQMSHCIHTLHTINLESKRKPLTDNV